MQRGDIIVGSQRGAFTGKPRPWLIVQNGVFLDGPGSVTVCPISTGRRAASFRITLLPDARNNLREASIVLVDKLMTLGADGVREVTGSLDPASMRQVDQALRFWLAL